MRRLAAMATAAAAILAACRTVGPDYKGPPARAQVHAPAANGPFAGAGEPGISPAAPPDHWWRLYDDPVLDGLVQQALAANTDLRVAAANLERAQAMLAETRSERSIATSVSAAIGYTQPSAEEFLQFQPAPAGFTHNVTFSAAYQVDLFGRLRRADEAARADVDTAAAARDAARVTIAAETARAYADVCGAGLRLAAVRRSLALQQQAYGMTVRLVRAGRGSAVDLTRTQSLLEQSRAGVPELEAAQRSALFRLAVLTGEPPEGFRPELLTCSNPPRLGSPLPAGDGAALLRRRPDVRQAERQLAASTARIGVATADLYPSISLGASAGSIGLLSDIASAAARTYNLGPLISWTFPNRSAARARIAAASAASAAALAHFDGVVLTSLRDAESALTTYSHDLQRDASLEAGRAQAATALGQAQRLQRAGRLNFIDVLDAERTLAGDDQALAASKAQLSADQIAVFLALGGGWQP